MEKRFNVLISAYACEPNKGSEPGVGWNFVKQISRFHQVWVITRANNREVIEAEIDNNPNIHWIYYDLPAWLKFWKRGNRGVHLYYYLWQICISFIAKRLANQIKFDIVHHVTFVMYWLPSFLWRLNLPFVWGPVGGGESPPSAFIKSLNFRGRFYERLRRLTQNIWEHDFFLRTLARKASLVLATTNETAVRLQKIRARKIQLFSQVALSNLEIAQLDFQPKYDRPFRFLSVGNLLHLKGFHLSIKAFKCFYERFGEGEYWIIGKGPQKKQLENLIKNSGLAGKIVLKGAFQRKEVFNLFPECHVFLQPGLHDSGGFASVEAMAARLPVICLDLGGPALQVTAETGFKIPAHHPELVVNDMAEAMIKLAKDPELCHKMGEAGRQRVIAHFNWDKKGEQINAIYREVLAQHENRRST